MRRNYRVSWFHFHWVHCSSISVVVFLWGPWFFFNRIKPLWGQHPSRSPLLISSRGTDVRTAVSNGCASQEWSCGFNPYVKYVTLDIIGYKIYIYTHIFIYIHLFFCWARLRSGARPADVENCRRYHSLFQGESADLLKKPEATRIFRTEKNNGPWGPPGYVCCFRSPLKI